MESRAPGLLQVCPWKQDDGETAFGETLFSVEPSRRGGGVRERELKGADEVKGKQGWKSIRFGWKKISEVPGRDQVLFYFENPVSCSLTLETGEVRRALMSQAQRGELQAADHSGPATTSKESDDDDGSKDATAGHTELLVRSLSNSVVGSPLTARESDDDDGSKDATAGHTELLVRSLSNSVVGSPLTARD
ncbi:hypothetical protein INR49_023429 [Caranx melampygus]|nr:hypothetical protein INR49_023429 [Caranx melampygus]